MGRTCSGGLNSVPGNDTANNPTGAGFLLFSFQPKTEEDPDSEMCGIPDLRRRTEPKISVTAILNWIRGGTVGRGTALQAGRPRVRFR